MSTARAIDMSQPSHVRLPISSRHALALAFDLAVRRDPIHSIVVPLLLRAPWALALVLLPAPETETIRSPHILGLRALALIGDFLTLLFVTAMLRIRARSVFNTPAGTRPAPASECYAQGLRRIPWLVITEIVRNMALILATSLLILPGLFLGFRLAVATEAVVLDEHDLAGAFLRSFRLMEHRFERWLELAAATVVLWLSVVLVCAVLWWGLSLSTSTAFAVLTLMLMPVQSVIQYTWTFFYLRLVETEEPRIEVGPRDAEAVQSAAAAHGL